MLRLLQRNSMGLMAAWLALLSLPVGAQSLAISNIGPNTPLNTTVSATFTPIAFTVSNVAPSGSGSFNPGVQIKVPTNGIIAVQALNAGGITCSSAPFAGGTDYNCQALSANLLPLAAIVVNGFSVRGLSVGSVTLSVQSIGPGSTLAPASNYLVNVGATSPSVTLTPLPTLAPTGGTPVVLAGPAASGSSLTGGVGYAGTGGIAAGFVRFASCTVSGTPVTNITYTGPAILNVPGGPASSGQIPLSCIRGPTAQTTFFSCAVSDSDNPVPTTLFWQVTCPPVAGPVAPGISFTPTAGPNASAPGTIALTGAPVGSFVSGSVAYSSAGGNAAGQLNIDTCAFSGASASAFNVTSALPISLTGGASTTGQVGLRCQPSSAPLSALLQCNTSQVPAAGATGYFWNVTCPALNDPTLTFTPIPTNSQATAPTVNFAGSGAVASANIPFSAAGGAPPGIILNSCVFNGTNAAVFSLASPTLPLSLPGGATTTGTLALNCQTTTVVRTALLQCVVLDSAGLPQPTRFWNVSCPAVAPVGADLSITKQLVGTGPFNVGQAIAFNLQVVNGSIAAAATGVSVQDVLPAGFDFVQGTGAGWSCTPSGTSPVTVDCQLAGSLAGGASASALTLSVRATAALAGTNQSNTAALTHSLPDPVPGNNSSTSAAFAIAPSADLAVLSVLDSTDPVNAGQNVTYSIASSNLGPSAVNAANMSLQYSAAVMDFVSVASQSAGWTCAPGALNTVGCNYGGAAVAANGAFPNVQLVLRAKILAAAATNTTTASISSALFDSNAANNSRSKTTAVQNIASVNASITESADPISVGGNVTYTINLNNASSGVATNLAITLLLPPTLSLQSASGTGFSCSGLTCTYSGNFAAGATAALSVVAQGLTPGAGEFRAGIAADQIVPGIVLTETTTVRGTFSRLKIDKRVTPERMRVGDIAEFTIGISNPNAVDHTNVRLIDQVPAGLTIIDVDGLECQTLANNRIECGPNTLERGDARTIKVRARASRAGSFSNEAEVDSDQSTAAASASASLFVEDATAPPPTQVTDVQISADFVRNSSGASVQVRISNIGSVSAENVVFTGLVSQTSLSVPTNVAGPEGFSCSLNGSGWRCALAGLLPPGANRTASSAWSFDSTRTARADFAVSTTTPETTQANNVTSSIIDGTAPPPPPDGNADLSLTKTVDRGEVGAGGSLVYRLEIKNLSTTNRALGVVLLDQLPAGLSFANAQIVQGNGQCARVGTTQGVRCDFAQLAANSAAIVALATTVQIGAQGSVTNTANVTAQTTDPVASNNGASVSSNVLALAIQLTRCAGNDRNALAAVSAVVAQCQAGNAALSRLCQALAEASTTDCTSVQQTLSGIAPDEGLAQSMLLRDFAATQFFNVDARLGDLRRGGGGFSVSGLNIANGRNAFGLGSLQGMLNQLQDGEDESGTADFMSPWGFFVNGSISKGDQTGNVGAGRVSTDFQTKGVTAGVDYRLSNRAVLGLALGYGDVSADVSIKSTIDAQMSTLTGYGSWYANDQFYVDGRFSLGRGNVKQARQVLLPVLGQELTARGDADVQQSTFAIAAGYHVDRAGWVLTPNVFLRRINTTIDAWQENGADAFNLRYGKRQDGATQWGAGLQMSHSISISSGVLTPQMDLNYTRNQSLNGAMIEWQFANTNDANFAQASEAEPDQAFGNVGLGIVYITANGRQAYVNYRRVLGFEGFDRGTLNLGARFDF